jgi:hypothetical protein
VVGKIGIDPAARDALATLTRSPYADGIRQANELQRTLEDPARSRALEASAGIKAVAPAVREWVVEREQELAAERAAATKVEAEAEAELSKVAPLATAPTPQLTPCPFEALHTHREGTARAPRRPHLANRRCVGGRSPTSSSSDGEPTHAVEPCTDRYRVAVARFLVDFELHAALAEALTSAPLWLHAYGIPLFIAITVIRRVQTRRTGRH